MNERIDPRSDAGGRGHPVSPPPGAHGTAGFPPLRARSLTGRRYRLPEDLEGTRNLLLVGFEPWHQAPIDSWLPSLEALGDADPGLRVYELVLAPRRLLPARPFIDGGMVRGIPDEAVRARTLTAYVGLGRVLPALGLPGTDQIALLLVDRAGHLGWTARGGFNPERAAALAAGLTRLR